MREPRHKEGNFSRAVEPVGAEPDEHQTPDAAPRKAARTGHSRKPMSLQAPEALLEGPSLRQPAQCDLAAVGDALPSLKPACHAPDGPLL